MAFQRNEDRRRDSEEFICLVCLKPVSADQPPQFNRQNCSCAEAGTPPNDPHATPAAHVEIRCRCCQGVPRTPPGSPTAGTSASASSRSVTTVDAPPEEARDSSADHQQQEEDAHLTDLDESFLTAGGGGTSGSGVVSSVESEGSGSSGRRSSSDIYTAGAGGWMAGGSPGGPYAPEITDSDLMTTTFDSD